MRGIHTVFTKPNDVGSKIHDMLQFELLTMVLSCLNWKKYNGEIVLYCDDDFYTYIEDLDLLWLWDSIDTETIKNIPKNVDYNTFWAYPKLYINSLQKEPFTSLDIDLYIDGPHDVSDNEIYFCNIERCDNDTEYPEYHKDPNFNKTLNYRNHYDYAANVALLVVNDIDFYSRYIDEVNGFVVGNGYSVPEGYKPSSLITFIEQRLLYTMMVSEGIKFDYHIKGIYDSTIEDWEDSYEANNLTHLWGWKSIFRNEEKYDERVSLTNELKEEVRQLFPDVWERVLSTLDRVSV